MEHGHKFEAYTAENTFGFLSTISLSFLLLLVIRLLRPSCGVIPQMTDSWPATKLVNLASTTEHSPVMRRRSWEQIS